MARSFTPRDMHALMNLLVKEATGQDGTIQAVDSSTFVSCGELLNSLPRENVYNALSIVIGRTFMASRPYDARLQLINAIDTAMYTNRMRKISFYSRQAQASGDFNTQLYTNLAKGYDNGNNSGNSTPSMWEQNPAVPLEMHFGGSSTWEDSTTIYDYQDKLPFRDEAEFADFVAGIMTERGNDIESQKEAFNRMTILNHIAGTYDLSSYMNNSVINLTSDYNEEFDTNYTTAELKTMESFFQYFVYRFKVESDRLTHRSVNYHWSPTKTVGGENYVLLRHTPKDRQRVFLYAPMFTRAEAMVFPQIFNDQYLNIDSQYEGVDYWQNEDHPEAIKVTPAIPDVTTGGSTSGTQIAGDTVALDHVVGILFDEDAMMVDYQLESATSTPLEARKHFRNLWWSFSKNAINDFTEKSIVFIMADE